MGHHAAGQRGGKGLPALQPHAEVGRRHTHLVHKRVDHSVVYKQLTICGQQSQ